MVLWVRVVVLWVRVGSCRFRLWSCGSELWSCGSELWSCGSKLWSCGSKLWSCGSKLWSCGSRTWNPTWNPHDFQFTHTVCPPLPLSFSGGTARQRPPSGLETSTKSPNPKVTSFAILPFQSGRPILRIIQGDEGRIHGPLVTTWIPTS